MKLKRFGKILVIVAVIMAMLMTVPVFAGSKPYKDVTVKKVGKEAYTAIVYLKKHHAYDGVIKGKKFYPGKKLSKEKYLDMLINLYGEENVPVNGSDLKNRKAAVTESYVCTKMVEVAHNLGIEIVWPGDPTVKLNRASVSRYVYNFTQFDSAFLPRH